MSQQQPYLLLTPGPLTTTGSVKQAMLTDVSTWDREYNDIVQGVRATLVELAVASEDSRAEWTSVLMQGSGTFSVEATIGTALPASGRLLVVENGAYGARIAHIAARLGIDHLTLSFGESGAVDVDAVARALREQPDVTHLAMVHCETTTGMLNPAAEVGRLCQELKKVYILDAMSSFGGLPVDAVDIGCDYLVSSANKCIQGVPGFGFVVCRREVLEATSGRARSLSLDLHDQWRGMQEGAGKWRFTSPTHTLLAFAQALEELALEGGVVARHQRYLANHTAVVEGFALLGLLPLLPAALRSPIITSFHCPPHPAFDFDTFYTALKRRQFVIYPGKLTQVPTFRVGHIGDLHPEDMARLCAVVGEVLVELGVTPLPQV